MVKQDVFNNSYSKIILNDSLDFTINFNNKYFQLILKGKSKNGFFALKDDFPFSIL